MDTKKCCIITSILTTGLLATAAPNWYDDYRPMLTPPKGARILPPTHPDDLTPGIYKSARSYCWYKEESDGENKTYISEAIKSVNTVCSDDLRELPNSLGASDSMLHIYNANGTWGGYTTPSQLAYILSNEKTWGSLAILLFANAKSCGGGNYYYKKNPPPGYIQYSQSASAQEETEIKNFLSIYPIISKSGLADQRGKCVIYKIG